MNLKGHELEFIESSHTYVCDGIILPSITQIISGLNPSKYAFVRESVLQQAAEKGVAMHALIQDYELGKPVEETQELHNYIFLKRHYKFEVTDMEVPVILFDNYEPMAAGRLDVVFTMNDLKGIADIKRTATFDKESVALQTNLYRIAYMQTYGTPIDLLAGIHLREDKRKFYNLPINEEIAWQKVREYGHTTREDSKVFKAPPPNNTNGCV